MMVAEDLVMVMTMVAMIIEVLVMVIFMEEVILNWLWQVRLQWLVVNGNSGWSM